MSDVKLGYALTDGHGPVNIPIRNMVVAGQTQEAGKTTTLEALISRSGRTAIAFVTKRGEQSFSTGRRIQPYFRERADWQFVESILEATMQERMKFERSWIIKVSKGARTLADVHDNVRRELKTARGINEGVYTNLDAYLSTVVPRIAEVDWAPALRLEPGLNVLDLSDQATFPAELQGLVMRSVLEAVYQHFEGVITIIPEAWEFIPQGRGSPVKLAAVELVRKGSGLKNHVWLDSQDIGGVDKEILRSCPVWLLGVQREANEIKRVLANIPEGMSKPKPAAIATLEKGQFIACFGKHAIKTYVQPEWMSPSDAEEIAAGELSIDVVLARRLPRRATTYKAVIKPLHADVAAAAIAGVRAGFDQPLLKQPAPTSKEHLMNPAQEKKLDRLLDLMEKRAPDNAAAPAAAVVVEGFAGAGASVFDKEALYQEFKARLMAEAPKLIKLLKEQPEIQLKVERVTVEVDLKAARGMIAKLIADGFFDEAKTANAGWNEVKRRWDYRGNAARIYEQCDWFTAAGFLTKEPSSGYRAVAGMKASIVE